MQAVTRQSVNRTPAARLTEARRWQNSGSGSRDLSVAYPMPVATDVTPREQLRRVLRSSPSLAWLLLRESLSKAPSGVKERHKYVMWAEQSSWIDSLARQIGALEVLALPQ